MLILPEREWAASPTAPNSRFRQFWKLCRALFSACCILHPPPMKQLLLSFAATEKQESRQQWIFFERSALRKARLYKYLYPSFSLLRLLCTGLPSLSPAEMPLRNLNGCIQLSRRNCLNVTRAENVGVSAIHRTGHRRPVSMSQYPLPKPVPLEHRNLPNTEVDESHGLWGFLLAEEERCVFARGGGVPRSVVLILRCLVLTDQILGRPWDYVELSKLNFENLHKLYWVCLKERNRVSTRIEELEANHLPRGKSQATDRIQAVSVIPLDLYLTMMNPPFHSPI